MRSARRALSSCSPTRRQGRARPLRLAPPPLRLPRGDRPPGLLEHLEGADHALLVVGVDPRGGGRIDGRELGVERRTPLRARPLFQALAQERIRVGPAEHPVEQRLEIEAGASDEQRAPPAGADGRVRLLGCPQPPTHVAALVGIDEIQGVVRDARALLGRGLGGADVHPAVHEHRVIDTISASSRSASSRAAAVLPTAVGPTRARSVSSGAGSTRFAECTEAAIEGSLAAAPAPPPAGLRSAAGGDHGGRHGVPTIRS